jgi:hypothetical protein
VQVKGDEKGPIAVKLQPCGGVSGRVTDHTGKPVKDAEVTFQMRDYAANDLLKQKLHRDTHTVSTDADGRFAFDRMFPGVEFDLFASVPGVRSGSGAVQGVTLKPGEAKDVGDIRFRDPKQADDE